MNSTEQHTLALMIINSGDKHANSYELCKILAWRFNIINCHEIINFLKSNKSIDSINDTGSISDFVLTRNGLEILKKYRLLTIEKLKVEFPNEHIIIGQL